MCSSPEQGKRVRKTHCLPHTSYGFVEEGIPSLVCKPDPAQGSLTSSWPVRNRAAQREVSSRVSKRNLSCMCSRSPFRTPPQSSSSCQISSGLDFRRSRNPPVDCTGEGSQLVTPYKSVQFSRSVVSNSLRLHGLQHPGLPVHYQLFEFTQAHVH